MNRRTGTAALLLASSAALLCGAAHAQQIVSITGERAVLTAGCDAGVRNGMTGKFCAPEIVSGRTVENCSARFVIVSVSAEQSVARVTRVTKGQDVHAGVLAKFDAKLSPGKCKPPPPDPKKALREANRAFHDGDYRGALERYENFLRVFPKDAGADEATERAKQCRLELAGAAALREANRAFHDGDYGGALERYENFLRVFPKAVGADEAAERAEQCRSKLATVTDPPSTVVAPPPAVPPEVLKANALVATAEAQLAAGKPAEALNSAVEALKLDSTNPRVHSILSTIRTKFVQSRFNTPADLAVTEGGVCYVADSGNNTIRRVAGGAATTIAGAAGQYGSIDGRADRARFNDPTGVAVAADGSVYVADRYNAIVRRLSMDGTVTTIAGRSGLTGASDGAAAAARFNTPRRLAVAADGSVYIADAGNHSIRRISAGVVETIVTANAVDRMDPAALAIDPVGNVLVADSWSHVIRRIDSDSRLSVFAGVAGASGSTDGPIGNARFNAPEGIAADRNGNVYVSDSGNHTIRKIANGVVTTVAGRAGLSGAIDGTGTTAARLNHPSGIACDAQGRLWIADSGNHTVRVLTDGFLETVAGLASMIGSADGAN